MRYQNGPAAGGTAIRAGNQVAERRFDTANRGPEQSTDPILGIRLRSFRPLPRGAPIGFALIDLWGGLFVHDCPVFRASSAFTALPSKPVIDRDGKQKADANGRQYVPVLEWRSHKLADRSCEPVVELVRASSSGTLADSA